MGGHDPHANGHAPMHTFSEDHRHAIEHGEPLTYTNAKLDEVHAVIAEGGNPLTAIPDLPRWEDAVGIRPHRSDGRSTSPPPCSSTP